LAEALGILGIDEMLARPNANSTPVSDLMKGRAAAKRRATADQSWLEASEAAEQAIAPRADTGQRN
jgi:hypothetical protein